jgi:hypothetical protein
MLLPDRFTHACSLVFRNRSIAAPERRLGARKRPACLYLLVGPALVPRPHDPLVSAAPFLRSRSAGRGPSRFVVGVAVMCAVVCHGLLLLHHGILGVVLVVVVVVGLAWRCKLVRWELGEGLGGR